MIFDTVVISLFYVFKRVINGEQSESDLNKSIRSGKKNEYEIFQPIKQNAKEMPSRFSFNPPSPASKYLESFTNETVSNCSVRNEFTTLTPHSVAHLSHSKSPSPLHSIISPAAIRTYGWDTGLQTE